jgi:hypothetical protein
MGAIGCVVTRTSLHETSDDVGFWLKRAPEERVAAVEALRQVRIGGDDGPRPEPQRVLASLLANDVQFLPV